MLDLKGKIPSLSNIGEQNYIDLDAIDLNGNEVYLKEMLTGKDEEKFIKTSQELQKEHCQLRYNENTKVLEQKKYRMMSHGRPQLLKA